MCNFLARVCSACIELYGIRKMQELDKALAFVYTIWQGGLIAQWVFLFYPVTPHGLIAKGNRVFFCPNCALESAIVFSILLPCFFLFYRVVRGLPFLVHCAVFKRFCVGHLTTIACIAALPVLGQQSRLCRYKKYLRRKGTGRSSAIRPLQSKNNPTA